MTKKYIKQNYKELGQSSERLLGNIEQERSDATEYLMFSKCGHFVVPEGVSSIKILALGASGGSGSAFGVLLNNAGEGGTAVSNALVATGETIEVFVGSQGCDGGLRNGGKGGQSIQGYYGGAAAPGVAGGGGGGGGASGAIRVRGDEVLIIAGGGGGGSGAGSGGVIGRGGAGGSFGMDGRGLSPGKTSGGVGSRGGDGPKVSELGSGGGGGGLCGGGAGSTCDLGSSGGGAGGSGTVVGSLSINGGGRSDGAVIISFVRD